jgi:hypothetical protein
MTMQQPLHPFCQRRVRKILSVWALGVLPLVAAAQELPNPYPRELFVGEQLLQWEFADGLDGWQPVSQCRLEARDGVLIVQALGGDPYLSAPAAAAGEQFVVRLRIKAQTDGPGQLFWSSSRHPGTSADRHVTFPLQHDGQWHEYQVRLVTDGDLTHLRLDPGTSTGTVQVDWIAVHRGGLHPLEIAGLEQSAEAVVVRVRNHADRPLETTLDDRTQTVPAAGHVSVALPASGASPLRSRQIRVQSPGLPDITRSVWIYEHQKAPVDAIRQTLGDLNIAAAPDGTQVQLRRGGRLVAALAPLVHVDGVVPDMQLSSDRWPLEYQGDGIAVTLTLEGRDELRISIRSEQPAEGPVVRVFGTLEQGLLSGVEYLGQGEHSSSKLDIETDEHLRVTPDPMHITMPLMAVVTDRGSVALAWDDMTLQPVFAVPDFLDGAAGHRLALRGTNVQAMLRIGDSWAEGGRLEPLILWDVLRRGLPSLPAAPRSFDAQMQLSLKAYQALMHDADNGGWFHAVVPGVRSSPDQGAYFADCASAIWRITGEMPDVPRLQLGGSHVRNSASYFVSGRADQWLETVNRAAAELVRTQHPDGSYRYDGRYRRGHFENTASGICARPAMELLEHARYTGNRESLVAGLKTLEFLQRFRTPRGAQTWEVPLHTPDILASAHAVWANVRAYELTGNDLYLTEARRWAITGLPFVYQWSNQPIMLYATTPVYGATNWVGPNWIGLPVQWCGTVYAYALLLLAEHDATLDWNQLAEGILICGEQMQYPVGPSVGCLPDVFELSRQKRRPADINPGALVSLRLRIAGHLDALSVGRVGSHSVVAPFPVTVQDAVAHIQGREGARYQVVIDGARIQEIQSTGRDIIPLNDP